MKKNSFSPAKRLRKKSSISQISRSATNDINNLNKNGNNANRNLINKDKRATIKDQDLSPLLSKNR